MHVRGQSAGGIGCVCVGGVRCRTACGTACFYALQEVLGSTLTVCYMHGILSSSEPVEPTSSAALVAEMRQRGCSCSVCF